MITHKWQQEFVKSLDGKSPQDLVEILIETVADLEGYPPTLSNVQRGIWKEEYIVQRLNSHFLTSTEWQKEQLILKETHQNELKSIQANLEEMTEREKKQRERNRALEIQIGNLKLKTSELKNLKNLENP